ncbi:MAG: FtsH protease activity modulator HflK [Methylococcaceae bacterium]|nr:FtsH protease activity modulator HflK [Methylococcaceae bacterium]
MAWNEPGGGSKDPWSGRDQDKRSPPDLDEVIRSMQEKMGGLFRGKKSGQSGNPMMAVSVVVLVLLVLWCLTGIYKIDAGWRGVITRFGGYLETTMPGLHWHYPSPIESLTKVDVEQQRSIEVGYRSGGRQQALGSVPREALILTEDENIVDVRLNVQYQVKDAKDFLFNVLGPSETLQQVTESAERGVVGQSKIDFVLLEGRSEIVAQVRKEIQIIMDEYGAGVQVTAVNLQDAQPPEEVQHAFEDAIKAREDKQRYIREAEAYMNDIIPKARGAAARRIQAAEGYQAKVVEEAKGEAARFEALLVEYNRAPEVTRKRLYIESIEKVLANTQTVLLDVEKGNNLMYLPLDRLTSRTAHVAADEPAHSPKYVASESSDSDSKNSRGSNRGREGRSQP